MYQPGRKTRRDIRIARDAEAAERAYQIEQERQARELLSEYGLYGSRRDVWSGQYETDKAWRDTDF